jgi:hypothetical protein
MEKGTIKGVLIGIAALIVVMIVSYLIGRNDGRIKVESAIVEKVDTLLVFDTITQYKPIYEERTIVKKELVPVPVTDTLWKTDTMYVYLDREQIVWQDEWSRVYASGILPQVDSVQHFITEKVVTKEIRVPIKQKSRWGLGIQAGYGIQFGKDMSHSPYIGVGLSYNILTW